MRFLVITSTILLSCHSGKLVKTFDPKCGQPCYGGDALKAGKGICSMGTWQCTDVGVEPSCSGWVAPKAEECNGFDNNCDGKIDSGNRLCMTACGEGAQVCAEGVWGACSAKQPQRETCNGLDDDCNGKVDDVTYANPYCYTGPQSTVGKGICHPGFLRCDFGVETCENQRLPEYEICDSIDNNCDGTVDEDTTSQGKDIVICIDESGSMIDKLPKVQTAARDWANKFTGRGDLRFALLSCPGHSKEEDGKVILRQNFTDANTFNTAIAKLYTSLNAGVEPTIDAVYMTVDPSNPLGLTWTANASRIVILFGDEEAQSGFVFPPITAAQTGMKAADAGVVVYGFINKYSDDSYDVMINPTGGKKFDIYGTTEQIGANLNSIVNECN